MLRPSLICLFGTILVFHTESPATQIASAQFSGEESSSVEASSAVFEEHSHQDSHIIPDEPAERVEWLKSRYQTIRQRTLDHGGKFEGPEPDSGQVLSLVTYPDYLPVNPGNRATKHYLVGQLHVLNQSDTPVMLKRRGIQLQFADEDPREQSNVTDELRGQSFQYSNSQGMSLGSMPRSDQVVIKPGETGSTWIFFSDIDSGMKFPDADLIVELNAKSVRLNLRQQVLGEINLRQKRIGPNGILAILELGGRLNMLGLSLLAETLDDVIRQNVYRAVIMWDSQVEEIDSGVMNFLYQYASTVGRNSDNRRADPRYPILPQQFRELHLVHTPGHNYSSSSNQITHDQPVPAVASALWSSFSMLSREELLKTLRDGHEWVKPGALSAGAARLSPRDLPMILNLSRQTDDQNLQIAAIYALRQFGDEPAIARLLELAQSSEEKLTPVAISSLSQSRFQASRLALRTLLAESSGEQKDQLLKTIVGNPAPAFADLYRDMVRDENAGFRVEALKALNAVGHEELESILRSSLASTNESLSDAAFEIILERRDPELEPLLEERVLMRLADGELDTNIQNYLRYSKNTRAVPILLDRLRRERENQSARQQLLTLLSSLGDERIESLFAELYPELSDYEKRTVLDALSQIQSPRFLKFASEAIASEKTTLIYSAINNLSKTDSQEAEQILIEGLSRIKVSSYFDNLANAVGAIGSEQAERALRVARESKDEKMRLAAINGLRYLERRKPGYQYIYQARYRMRRRSWDEAFDYIKIAIEMDPSLASAYSTQGNILLKMKKYDEADAAFREALERDPNSGEAIVGRLRIQARQGRVDEAVGAVEKLYVRFAQDNEFEYQTGLLFADAVNLSLGRDPDNPVPPPDAEDDVPEDEKPDAPAAPEKEAPETKVSEETIKHWTTESLSWISNAARHNYVDRSLLMSSPELDAFKENPDYQKAIRGQLPERKIEVPEKGAKQASLEENTQEGDLVILQVGAEMGDGDDIVIDLPPPPAR